MLNVAPSLFVKFYRGTMIYGNLIGLLLLMSAMFPLFIKHFFRLPLGCFAPKVLVVRSPL